MQRAKTYLLRANKWLASVVKAVYYSRISRAIFSVAALVILAIYIIGWRYQRAHSSEPLELGVSYSIKYAEDLGLDADEGLDQLLDLGFRRFRLMSYWDRIEPQRDEYDFSWLDRQIDAIESRGGSITLALGMRQPRYPECHIPGWTSSDTADSVQLLEFIELVIKRYQHRPVISSWQLENEAMNRLFGECPDFDRLLLSKERDLVKFLDPDRQLVINASNTIGVPWRQPLGDRVGFSYYRHWHYRGIAGSYWYVPDWWHAFRAQLAEWHTGQQPFIHELQAEPWGPGWIGDLSFDEQSSYFAASDMHSYVQRARGTGMNEIYLWGAEFWLYRAQAGDPSYLDAAQTQLSAE